MWWTWVAGRQLGCKDVWTLRVRRNYSVLLGIYFELGDGEFPGEGTGSQGGVLERVGREGGREGGRERSTWGRLLNQGTVFFMLARGMGVMNRISRVALPKGFWLVEGPSQDIDDRYSRRRERKVYIHLIIDSQHCTASTATSDMVHTPETAHSSLFSSFWISIYTMGGCIWVSCWAIEQVLSCASIL